MEKLNVFISSTYYDLQEHRENLHNKLTDLGHEVILHERKGIYYNNNLNTHVSCIKAVENEADILVLIIGERFGGEAVPDVFNNIDFDELKDKSKYKDFFLTTRKYSITQCEFLKAIEKNIPVFVFVSQAILDAKSIYDRSLKAGAADLSSIRFFEHEKDNRYAEYIFQFIKFISNLNISNAIFGFKTSNDIVHDLKINLSALAKDMLKRNKSFASSSNYEDDIEFTPPKIPSETIIEYFFNDANRKRSIQIIDTHLTIDEKGGCDYSSKIKIRPIDPLTHYHYQVYTDKKGEIKIQDFKILERPSENDFFGIKKGTCLRATLFFKEEKTREFTVILKLYIENYLSDLIEKNKGVIHQSLTNGAKKFNKINLTINFPNTELFQNLRLRIINHPEKSNNGKYISCKKYADKKVYKISFFKADGSDFNTDTELSFVR